MDTDRELAIQHCKEHDLIDFIGYGPDDCHSFQLVEVEMSEEQYAELCELYKIYSLTPKDKGFDKEVLSKVEDRISEILEDIYEEKGYKAEEIICTDGCSDYIEMARFYKNKLAVQKVSEHEMFEVLCPHCQDEFLIDKGMLEKSLIQCIFCQQKFRVELEDDDEELLDDICDQLCDDEKLFDEVIREYIDATY
jgi:hypothetical protein